MEQMEFVDAIFALGSSSGHNVKINRNGDRQIDFGNKQLTADHLRLIFQDIVRKKGIYAREDLEALIAGRPCAAVPFFELATKAGFCTLDKKSYRFNFAIKG